LLKAFLPLTLIEKAFMNETERGKLEKTLITYFKEIHKICTDSNFREESFYPSLKRLFEDCSKLYQAETGVNILVALRKTEPGIPDFRVNRNDETIAGMLLPAFRAMIT
jgi:hypothetical protein